MAPLVVHATAVAWEGRAVLILGPSGSGKSSLGLELMALGAELVADDRTELSAVGRALVARCPPAIRGLVEARGVGVLTAEAVAEARVALVADLGAREDARLPAWRDATFLGIAVPCVARPLNGPFAAAILQVLKSGRRDPADPRPA